MNRDLWVLVVLREKVVVPVQLVPEVLPVLWDQEVHRESEVISVQRVTLETWGFRAFKEIRDQLDQKVIQVLLDRKVILDLWGLRGQKASEAKKENEVLLVNKVLPECKVLKVNLDRKVFPAIVAVPVHKANKASPV